MTLITIFKDTQKKQKKFYFSLSEAIEFVCALSVEELKKNDYLIFCDTNVHASNFLDFLAEDFKSIPVFPNEKGDYYIKLKVKKKQERTKVIGAMPVQLQNMMKVLERKLNLNETPKIEFDVSEFYVYLTRESDYKITLDYKLNIIDVFDIKNFCFVSNEPINIDLRKYLTFKQFYYRKKEREYGKS